MCGIFGILNYGNDIHTLSCILQGLEQLQNRGYDSVGLCAMDGINQNYLLEKYASTEKEDALLKLKNNLKKNQEKYTIGVGHNRWATHGSKTDHNAHPHWSNNKDFIIVHNGIIENYQQIKDKLVIEGFQFFTSTDTEVIANLLEYNQRLLMKTEGLNEKEKVNIGLIIEQTIHDLQGTYGLVIIYKPISNKLYCVRNGSPLLVGYHQNYCIVTSEQSGFCQHVNSYITLQNDDICEIECIDSKIVLNYQSSYEFKKLSSIKEDLTPSPYAHWTLKEIMEQPRKILNSINLGGRILDDNHVKLGGLNANKEKLKNIEHIILLGCGTSYFSAMYGKHFFKKLCNFETIQLYDGADFEESDLPKKGEVLMIFISQSGETKDLHRCIQIANQKNIVTMGIINVVDSLIAREVDFGIYCNAGREMGVASTKAFTTQVVCLCLCALWFSQERNINEQLRTIFIKDLRNLSNDFEQCLKIVEKQLENPLALLSKFEHLFILGKNCDECIAREGALKIKEISYIHSEAYSSSALKHGPFALLGKNMPVILLNNQLEYESKVINCYEEVQSRNSPILYITNNRSIQKENIIYVQYNKSFASLLSIIPLQLLAYHLSVQRENNPDKPKNLAKVVTVE